MICPRPAEIDRGDGLAHFVRPLAKTKSGVDHQRRSDHEHRIGALQRARRGIDALSRDVLTEKHDGGLEGPIALRATRHAECIDVVGLQIRISIRSRCGNLIPELRILIFQPALNRLPRMFRAAAKADYVTDIAVKLDHGRTPGALVQTIHILRDELLHATPGFELAQSNVRSVGHRPGYQRPAEHAARPVAPARSLCAQKILQLHGRRTLPLSVTVAVTRDTRLCADARAGQYEQPRMPPYESFEAGRVVRFYLPGSFWSGNLSNSTLYNAPLTFSTRRM